MTQTFESQALDSAVVAGIRNRLAVPYAQDQHGATTVTTSRIYDLDGPDSYWHVIVTRKHTNGVTETSGQDYLAWAPNRPDGLAAHAAIGDALQAAAL